MMQQRTLFFCLAVLGSSLHAGFQQRTVTYELDGVTLESTIVWDGELDKAKPGILMVPNWMGPTEASLKKARKVADDDYVVMMVDMYGTEVRPQSAAEAGAAAGALRADRALMRARAAKALEVFREQGESGKVPLKTKHIAGIGFCFGGGTVLELARSGIDLDAVVSFHGDLLSPTLAPDAANTRAKVLVLHGAADPYVPQEHVQEWVSVMNETAADWMLVQFSGAVHSFTDPLADSEGARYDKRTAKRAFEMMDDLLDEIWD